MKKKILTRTPKRTDNDKPATKADLQGVKADLQNEIKDVRGEIQRVKGHLENRIDKSEIRFEEKLTQFKSEILNGVDKVYGELVALREESTIHYGRRVRTDEILENHEGRIKKLENLAAPKI